MAVKDGRLSRNVATGVNLPRIGRHEHRYLTHDQVDDLATATRLPARPRASTAASTPAPTRPTDSSSLFLAYTGVRFGEMAALRVARLDLHRSRAVIVAVGNAGPRAGLVWGTPKTHQRREVPIPGSWSASSRARVAQATRRPGLRRHPQGQPLRVSPFRTAFTAAAKPSASPTCTRTSSGTPPPASRSPAAPTSRWSSSCSDTPRRR